MSLEGTNSSRIQSLSRKDVHQPPTAEGPQSPVPRNTLPVDGTGVQLFSLSPQVRDHDQAVAVLRAEVRSSVSEARTLLQETRRLRHDQRKYLLRQLDAARAYEKQLKSELKQLDNDKRDEVSVGRGQGRLGGVSREVNTRQRRGVITSPMRVIIGVGMNRRREGRSRSR